MKLFTKAQTVENEEKVLEREKQQFKKMTQTPMARLIIGLGIPTTLSMMVTSLYNLADMYFVSLLGNPSATSAASNLLALMSIIQAVGFTFGMGSGSIVSIRLGKRDREGADTVASSSLFIAAVSGLVILLLGLLFLTPLMRLFGSIESETLRFSEIYGTYILLAAPIMCMSFVLNNVLRAEGKAVLSMIGLIVGALVNVALDPILIFVADMGIRGAAVATFASQILSFCILLFMFLSGKTIVRMRLQSISRKFEVYKDVIATGFPSFCRQILASLCTVFLNNAAYTCGLDVYGTIEEGGVVLFHGGVAAQTALGVVQKVFMLAFSLSLGIGQGYQPVLGYNYSAKRFDRVKSAYLFTLGFSTAVMVVFGTVCFIFASNVMDIFSLTAQAKEIGKVALQLQCLCMPLLPLNFMAGITYQSIGNKAIASLLSISRQGLFYIPFVLILPKVLSLFGVQSCQAVSDFFAFFFALPFTFMFFKSLKKKQAEWQKEQQTADVQV